VLAVVNRNQTARRLNRKAILLAGLLPLLCCHNPKAAQQDGRAIQQKLRHGRFAEVLDASSKHADRWRDRPSSDAYVTFRLLESEAYLALKNASAASAILDPLQPAGPYLRTRRDLDYAEALFRSDEYRKAGALLDRGIESAQANRFAELEIDAFNLRGQLLGKSERYAEADEAYRIALGKAENLNDAIWRARLLGNLGQTRLKRKRYDDALTYYEKARAAVEKEDVPWLASVFLSNQAICYKELGDIDRALRLRMQALAIQEKLPPSGSLMNSYGEIGRIYESRNDRRQAIAYYRRALSVADRLHIKSDAATWAVNLSLAYADLEDWPNAEKANHLAKTLDPTGEDDLELYEDLSSAAALAARGDFAGARRKYQQVADSPADNARTQWTAYDELGKLYEKAGDHGQADRNFEKAIARIAGSRVALAKDDHKITFLSEPIGVYRDYVAALIDRQADGAAMLAADSSRAQTMLGEAPARTTARDFQRVAATSNSVLLSYWLTPQQSYAWIVTARGVERVTLPQNDAGIQELVRAYRDEILNNARDPLTNSRSAGWRLSDAVLRPLEDRIPPGSHVIAVLDGALHDIPLETLPVTREHRQYWLERVTFSVAPSLASLTGKAGMSQPASGGILAIGDAEPGERYPKLPQARAEIAAIESRFPRLHKTVLTGADANVERYRAERPERFSLIHFAAHAEASSTTPLDSAVILSPHNSEYKLYARDVANSGTPLGAELVTISGCTSAGSQSYRGEGLVGLEWAFLHAGARNVVAGLWEADDVATARLMNRFYAELEAGRRPADALRAAKLELVGAKRTPYYWGPFQVYRRTAE
jgi:CHAT domain-containing protein/tetratricopeptide (TPR) repeat protein